jgi:ABC-type microcin C transport system permease subunit YejB
MLGQYARFDLGKSFFQNKDVWHLIKEKLPVSISLGLWTFFISYLIAVPLGVAKAVRAGSRFDFVTTCWCWSAMRSPASCWAWRCWWSSAASCSGSRCAG